MFWRQFFLGPAFFLLALTCGSRAEEPLRFDELFKLIRPQATESRWRELHWLTSAAEARKQAALEGKPIFIWSGGGCPPLGSC